MSEEIIHTKQTPSYSRRPDEPASDYEAFVEWCRIPPSSRSTGNFCRRTGFPQKAVKRMREKWQWDARAAAFDADSVALRPDPASMEEEAALAGQIAAATTLIELGLRSIELKNPSLISADKALKLVEKGVEIQRKALGQADVNIEFSSGDLSRVNKLIEDLNIEDAELVDEELEE
jgi:hypothetical protein